MNFKQVIVVRKDLNMRKGKMIAQGAHASVNAALLVNRTNHVVSNEWFLSGSKKIVVGIESESELVELHDKFKRNNIPVVIITDMGLTEFSGPTLTALAAGPWDSDELDKITADMKLL